MCGHFLWDLCSIETFGVVYITPSLCCAGGACSVSSVGSSSSSPWRGERKYQICLCGQWPVTRCAKLRLITINNNQLNVTISITVIINSWWDCFWLGKHVILSLSIPRLSSEWRFVTTLMIITWRQLLLVSICPNRYKWMVILPQLVQQVLVCRNDSPLTGNCN